MRWLILWATLSSSLLAAPARTEGAGEGEERETFTILGHRARIQLLPLTSSLRCTDTLSIRMDADHAGEIALGLLPMYAVEKVTIAGDEAAFHRQGDLLRVEDLPADTVFSIEISYVTRVPFQSEYSRISDDRAVLREEELLPRGNREYRSVRFTLVVPAGWYALTVGKLTHKEERGDSTEFTWEENQPLPSVSWFCAGKYWSQPKYNAPLPIAIHLFEEDSAYAVDVLVQAQKVIEFYSSMFTPYRFSKLEIIEVDDWVAGANVLAVASPSFIMVKKAAFTTDDVFNQVHSILAHEIAHQWWPATVFIDEEDAALLSEGLCEYSALLYHESVGELSERDSLQTHPLLRPLIMNVMRGNDRPLQEKADLRSLQTHYLKASYVHNMLGEIVGRSALVRIYHLYASRFQGRLARLADFIGVAEEVSGRKLGWFFDQWVKRRGIPRLKLYNVKSAQAGTHWITRGRVRMVGYEKYTTLIDVGVVTPSETSKTRLWIGADSTGTYRNDVPFEIRSLHKPFRAILDPGGEILKIQKLPVKFGDLRAPADGIMIVGSAPGSAFLLDIARRDSANLDAAGWSLTIAYDTSVTLMNLQNDRVFLYGKAGENTIVEQMEEKFSYGFTGDSVRVKNETVFDSTLALVQVIENPFTPQGLLCWIAPLTERATPELLPFDASWVLLRGKEQIASGTWVVKDEELVVEVK